MSFITDEDRRLHNQHSPPCRKAISPHEFDTTEEYLENVGKTMADYARLSYREGSNATCQMWAYAPELSNWDIRQALYDAVKKHTSEDTASIDVETNSINQEESAVSLKLKV